ncbi:MAG: DUF3592 domain-containing protein [Chitinivibrionales bacterium]|nr:DUF3592 domain-containing protein [Chitinivibrionales bacterium]
MLQTLWHSILKIATNYNQTSFGLGGTLFLLIPLAMLILAPFGIYQGARIAWRFYKVVPTWPTTTGEITVSGYSIQAHMEDMGGQNATFYGSNIKFKYFVDGIEYNSDKITWGGAFYSNDRRFAQQDRLDYALGKKILVHYNPQKPSDCIVKMKYTYKMAIPWIGGVGFIIFGVGFGWGMLFFIIKQLTEKGLWF